MTQQPQHAVYPWVAPFGGRQGRLGTNPMAFAAPTGERPVLMDFSTSSVPEGRIRLYRDTKRALPEPWLLDIDGRPSTDPNDLYNEANEAAGAIRPFGGSQGYKSFGLSLMAQTLGALLGGPIWNLDTIERYTNGFWLLVLDPRAFADHSSFASDLSEMIGYIRSSAPDAGGSAVMMPGQREFDMMEQRRAEGVPIDDHVWKLIVETAASVGVDV